MKDGWIRRRLCDVTTKIGSGATPQGGEANYKRSGITLIRSLNVHDGGATRQALTKGQLQDFSIVFPESLAEQQRIVCILDEAFDGIATAKANAEKNLQNARALFESHIHSVFNRPRKGWDE